MSPKTYADQYRTYMLSPDFEVHRIKSPQPREVALHHHDFYEIYFFISGNVMYNIESKSYLLTPGDILLIQPMQLHQPVFQQETGSYERIVLWLSRPFLEQFHLGSENLSTCFHSARPGHAGLLRPDEQIHRNLLYLLEQLMQERGSSEYGCEISCLSYLSLILAQLCRLSIQEPQEVDLIPSSRVVYDVMEYINQNYAQELTLDSLANQFFISKYHLSREFARITGSSVHRYITQRRLIIAKQLIADGVSTGDACQRCGFGDYSSFYRAFKNTYQISPRDYLLRLKRDAEDRAAFPLDRS